jgi:hypothetical protein
LVTQFQSVSEVYNPTGKFIFIARSDASGIFGLPSEVAAKVSNKRLVNFYVDNIMRTTLATKIISLSCDQSVSECSFEWTYTGLGKRFTHAFDKFIFKGTVVYQMHIEYDMNDSAGKGILDKMEQSLHIFN